MCAIGCCLLIGSVCPKSVSTISLSRIDKTMQMCKKQRVYYEVVLCISPFWEGFPFFFLCKLNLGALGSVGELRISKRKDCLFPLKTISYDDEMLCAVPRRCTAMLYSRMDVKFNLCWNKIPFLVHFIRLLIECMRFMQVYKKIKCNYLKAIQPNRSPSIITKRLMELFTPLRM